MASFRFLYVESDNPRAAMDALKLFVDGGLPTLPEPEPAAKPIGRPRTEAETEAAEMLSEGVPAGVVAERLGIHRNTVTRIKQRVEADEPGPDNDADDDEESDEIEEPTEIEDEPEDDASDDEKHVTGATKIERAFEQLGIEATAGEVIQAAGKFWSHKPPAGWRNVSHAQVCQVRKRLKASGHRPARATDSPPPEPEPKKSAAALPLEAQANMIATLLKSDQPLDLAEISRTTRIPQADCFQILKGESFERDTDGMYWIAK